MVPGHQGAKPAQPAPPAPFPARDPAEFADRLRLLKVWAGNPSFEELRRRCGVPTSTLSDAVGRGPARLPALAVVRAFVAACGVPPDGLAAWESAWRELRQARDRGAPHELCQARDRGAPHEPAHPAGRPVEPHQLPHDLPDFAGRAAELDRLAAAAARGAPVVALTGPPGAGKTALAVRWAHRVAGHYPDGQIFLDLRGASRRGPLSASAAARFALGALGVPAADVPHGARHRLARYRSLAYGRRLLVVLDNARDAAQVRPLIPGGPGCLTLVTSRDRLSGLVALDGAGRVPVAGLAPDESVALLAALLTDRRADDRRALYELADLCDHQPLALRIAAARLVENPDWPVCVLAGALAGDDRLAGLALPGDDPGTSVRAAFDLSYAALDTRAQWLFRRLAALPGDSFTPAGVAVAAALPVRAAARLLGTLSAGHLLEVAAPERYTLSRLARGYAVGLLEEEYGPAPASLIRRPRRTPVSDMREAG